MKLTSLTRSFLLQAELQQKNKRRIKTKKAIERKESQLKQQEEESRRKGLEETRKCEEEVAKRRMLHQARADLEIKHFEEKQGMCFCCQPYLYYCERLVLFTKYVAFNCSSQSQLRESFFRIEHPKN